MKILNLFKRWKNEEDGVAAVEAGMIFPIMLMMMIGVFDLGNGILANQKAIRSSQVVADLLARQNSVNATDLNEAVQAGRLAFEPLPNASFGVDIVSFRFDEDANTEIVWRETVNMTPVADAISRVDALQEADEGVLMVVVKYQYNPLFAGFIMNGFTSTVVDMQEVAFSRGRRSPVVALDGS